MAKEKKTKKTKEKAFHEALVGQLLTLVTSGFGVVAALAWNDAIQQFVKLYIEPKIPGSGLFYQFIYAILITLLIVLTTYFLSKIAATLKAKREARN